MLDSPTITKLLVIGASGLVAAINVIIIGLVVIAVLHDGTTATDIASTLQTILIDAITAIGTLAGSLITGRYVHNAMLAGQAQAEQQTQTTAQVVKEATP